MTAGKPTKHLWRGRRAEDRARQYLTRHGLKLVTRNYRSPFGEIDLIMREKDVLVFVEVRYRRHEQFGTAAETIDARKRDRIRATAEHFIVSHRNMDDVPCRFDVMALSGDLDNSPNEDNIHWYTDAF